MSLKQIITKPLRILGLGVEPKDSVPLSLSEEMQKSLSLICGQDRQSIIPVHVGSGGFLSVAPPSIADAEVVSMVVGPGTPAVFDPPVDLLEVLVIDYVGLLAYDVGSFTHYALPFASSVSWVWVGSNMALGGSSQSYRIAGPIDSFQFGEDATGVNPYIYYNAIRFKHGKE